MQEIIKGRRQSTVAEHAYLLSSTDGAQVTSDAGGAAFPEHFRSRRNSNAIAESGMPNAGNTVGRRTSSVLHSPSFADLLRSVQADASDDAAEGQGSEPQPALGALSAGILLRFAARAAGPDSEHAAAAGPLEPGGVEPAGDIVRRRAGALFRKVMPVLAAKRLAAAGAAQARQRREKAEAAMTRSKDGVSVKAWHH